MKPITPDYDRETPVRRTPLERAQQARITDLTTEINNLRAIIRKERVRHNRLEAALSKYQAILESTITEQREAFKTLGKELVPSALRVS
ncbi:MAG TPA: hypothetical protein VMP68_02380 [Candidatus Eisenbacteria bacterium]|nr:hypothetical protein [Candidatus Eisenbacteria bacterium]